MFIVVLSHIFRKNFVGITIFPFIFLRNKQDQTNKKLINHETIHLVQQIELCILPFFIWYILEYIIRLMQYRNAHQAYRNISFEREAYHCEGNLNYLRERRFYSFINYI